MSNEWPADPHVWWRVAARMRDAVPCRDYPLREPGQVPAGEPCADGFNDSMRAMR